MGTHAATLQLLIEQVWQTCNTQEREALMCKVAVDAALGQLPSLEPHQVPMASTDAKDTPESASSPHTAAQGRSQDVVMVVGSAHLPGAWLLCVCLYLVVSAISCHVVRANKEEAFP